MQEDREGEEKAKSEEGRTAFQMIADCEIGDYSGVPLFQEHCRVMKGRKQLVWSRGLREELGLNEEQTDEALAAALPAEYIVLASITAAQWRVIKAADWVIQARLIDIGQTGDKSLVTAFLRDLGIAAV